MSYNYHRRNLFNKQEEEKTNLKKGSLQRRNPFNPMSEENQSKLKEQREWTHEEEDSVRQSISPMEGSARFRALNKLAAKTHVRKHPETGERMFLMHRGMGREEYKGAHDHKEGVTKYDSNERTSWTPKYDIPHDFATSGGGVVSAWVPESAIVHSSNQYNTPTQEGIANKNKPFGHTKNGQKRAGGFSITERDEDEFIIQHNKPFFHADKDFVSQLKDNKSLERFGLNDWGLKPTPDVRAKINKPARTAGLEGEDKKELFNQGINLKQKVKIPEQEDLLAANEKEETDLKKMSRGLPEFKNFPKVTNRPDQEVQNTDTKRQVNIFAEKAKNYSKYRKDSYYGGKIRDQVKPFVSKPRNETYLANKVAFKDRYGYDLPKDQFENTGVAIGGSVMDAPVAAVSGEGKNITGKRREHEAIHHTFNLLGKKYGEEIAEYAKNKTNELIHPSVKDILSNHMKKVGYGEKSHVSEFLPHLYEMLHDPKTRDMIGHTVPEFKQNEREIMNHAKKSWNAIRDFTSKLKAGDER